MELEELKKDGLLPLAGYYPVILDKQKLTHRTIGYLHYQNDKIGITFTLPKDANEGWRANVPRIKQQWNDFVTSAHVYEGS